MNARYYKVIIIVFILFQSIKCFHLRYVLPAHFAQNPLENVGLADYLSAKVEYIFRFP
jgi:hypothetical protein